MTTLSIQLPDKLVAALDVAAKARRKSRTAFVREVLAEQTRAVSAPAGKSLLERTRNLRGIGASGLGDLSCNPRHLDDLAR